MYTVLYLISLNICEIALKEQDSLSCELNRLTRVFMNGHLPVIILRTNENRIKYEILNKLKPPG